MKTEHHAKDISHLFVEQFFCNFTFFYRFFQRLCHTVFIEIVSDGHLNIQAAFCCLFCLVDSSPVGYDHAVIAPFFAKNLIQKFLVFAAMFSFVKVISSHHGIRFFCRFFECREVDFSRRTVADFDIYPETFCLLIIDCKVLHTGCNICGLDTLDHRHCHLTAQVRIFTHIFEISAAERTSFDVDPWCEDDVFSASSCLFSEDFSCLIGKSSVPCRCQCAVAREIGYIVIAVSYRNPGIVRKFIADSHRAVRHLDGWDSQTLDSFCTKKPCAVDHADFFIKRQLFYQIFDLLFDLFIFLHFSLLIYRVTVICAFPAHLITVLLSFIWYSASLTSFAVSFTRTMLQGFFACT